MGFAEVHLNSPEQFLKIGDGIHAKRVDKDHLCCRRIMPEIPKVEKTRCHSAPNTHKNFKLINIRSIETAKPKPSNSKCVYTKNGDFKAINLPFYVYRSNYGKNPKYLEYRIKEIQSRDQIARSEEIKRQPICQFITQDERNALLRVTFNSVFPHIFILEFHINQLYQITFSGIAYNTTY